jgi:hypothetical protein
MIRDAGFLGRQNSLSTLQFLLTNLRPRDLLSSKLSTSRNIGGQSGIAQPFPKGILSLGSTNRCPGSPADF